MSDDAFVPRPQRWMNNQKPPSTVVATAEDPEDSALAGAHAFQLRAFAAELRRAKARGPGPTAAAHPGLWCTV